MTARRSLNLKLIFSVLAAFLLSLAFSWLLHDRLSERDAYALINRTFTDVENELTDCINERLVLQCMAVRERLEDENGHSVPVTTKSLQDLARELRVTEISIACGFSSPSYFCKAFHDLTGLSPRDFRRANRVPAR